MVQNEINNLGFLTGQGKAKMSKVNEMDITFDVTTSKDKSLMRYTLIFKFYKVIIPRLSVMI